jgi:hypothetical protein
MATRRVLSVYTLGIHGLVPAAVARAIGLPAGRRQARVLIVAPTKAAAFTLARAARCGDGISASNPEFQATGWPLAQQIRDWAPGPAVYVLPMDVNPGAVVVMVNADGFQPVGRTHRPDGERYGVVFVSS